MPAMMTQRQSKNPIFVRWRRRTNVWRKSTSLPTRADATKAQTAARCAIPPAPAKLASPRCGVMLPVLPPFGGASRAESEHEPAPSRAVFFPLPAHRARGDPGYPSRDSAARTTLTYTPFSGWRRRMKLSVPLAVAALAFSACWHVAPDYASPPASTSSSPRFAATGSACRCMGCGCKGGPGWRGQNGQCVSHANLTKDCGSPPSTRCTHEGAQQVCPSRG